MGRSTSSKKYHSWRNYRRKGEKVLTQVTANNALEAKAAEEAGFDMIIGSAYNVKKVREGSKKLFLYFGSLSQNEYLKYYQINIKLQVPFSFLHHPFSYLSKLQLQHYHLLLEQVFLLQFFDHDQRQ